MIVSSLEPRTSSQPAETSTAELFWYMNWSSYSKYDPSLIGLEPRLELFKALIGFYGWSSSLSYLIVFNLFNCL